MKKALLVLVLAMIGLTATAKPVDPITARQVAANFWNAHRDSDVAALTSPMTAVAIPFDAMYLFAAEDNGFVLVAADDCVQPILAYSFHSPAGKQLNREVRYWLSNYQQQIDWLRAQGAVADEATAAQWALYSQAPDGDPRPLTAVSPLLTTTWDQSPYYNNLCPYDATEQERAVTGCVATATAQVMKYWNHPAQGTGSHSYTHTTYGTLSANFGATTYNWASMPNALTSSSSTAQVNAVATLMYHIGVAIEMDYGVDASGAYMNNYGYSTLPSTENALPEFFGYDNTIVCYSRDNLSDNVWRNYIVTELDAQRPVLYAGSDTAGGHCFVCDGYNNNNMVHFNWGWGGYQDGYYTLANIAPGTGGTGGNATYTFNMNQHILTGVKPASGSSGGSGIAPDPNCLITSFPYTENFDDTTHYSCLRIYNANADTVTWGLANGYGVNSSVCAFIMYAVNADDYLILPGITTPGNYSISWKAKIYNSNYPESYQVLAGDNVIYNETLTSTSYVTRTATFTVAAGDTVLPMFRYISNDMYYFFLDDITISQSTAPSQYTITVQSANPTMGSVSGGGTFAAGATTTIGATANSGYHFTQWNDGNANASRTITVTGNATYTAYFEANGAAPTSDTISYCDTNSIVTSMGAGGSIYWGIMLTPAQLSGRNYLKSVMLMVPSAGTYTLTIYSGGSTAPGTLAHTQTAVFSSSELGWQEILLDATYAINQNQNLWITFYNNDAQYPAAACAYVNNSNSDWASLDGSTWAHLQDYGGSFVYSWMIKAVTMQNAGPQPAPTVHISGPISASVGVAQTFTATATTGATVTWTLNGATPSTATGLSTTATWNTPGTYNVIATATNSAGTGHDTLTISVVSCGIITTFPYTMGFEANEAAALSCWTVLDVDGDGYSWTTGLVEGVAASASYINDVGALTPDNWLISPQMQFTAGNSYILSWTTSALDADYYNEHYGVYVSTSGTAPSNFTLVQEYTMTSPNETDMTLDLSAYAGQNIYIAFRHWNVTDVYWMLLDDITVTQSSNPTQNYTITVLSANEQMGTVSGGGTFPAGTTISISASPKSGYRFTAWNDGNTNASRNITVTGNATYIASFAPITGIESTDSESWTLYPNPATDVVTVTGVENASIVVTDITGRTVATHTIADGNNRLDVSRLVAGAYFLRITSDGVSSVQKLVIR